MSTFLIEGVEVDDTVRSWVEQTSEDLNNFIQSHEFRGGIYVDGMVAGFSAGIVSIVKNAITDTDPKVSKRLIKRVMGLLLALSERVVEIGEEIK